jgi:hypothetical protein
VNHNFHLLQGSAKHFIPHNAITCSIVKDDIVACVLLLYNPVVSFVLSLGVWFNGSERFEDWVGLEWTRFQLEACQTWRKLPAFERNLSNLGETCRTWGNLMNSASTPKLGKHLLNLGKLVELLWNLLQLFFIFKLDSNSIWFASNFHYLSSKFSSPNPQTRCPLHVHAYRLDSELTAHNLNDQLQVTPLKTLNQTIHLINLLPDPHQVTGESKAICGTRTQVSITNHKSH